MQISQKVTVEMTVKDVQAACAHYIESKGLMGVPSNKVILTPEGARVTFTAKTPTLTSKVPESSSDSQQQLQMDFTLNMPLEDTVLKCEGGITPIPQETPEPQAEELSKELTTQADVEITPFDPDAMKRSPLFV